MNRVNPSTDSGAVAASRPIQREVSRILNPAFADGELDGQRARRLIDGRDIAGADPFLLMAEDWMPRDAFANHPHRGIETFTMVLEGAIEHSDSAGHGDVLEAGDAQWLTAGRGIIHNENALPGTVAHTLQLWINLPAAQKMAEPRYQDFRSATLPTRNEPGVEVKVISGASGETISPTLNHVPVTAIDARLGAAAVFEQALEPSANAFILVLEGQALIGGMKRLVEAGELAWLTRADEASSTVAIATSASPARVLLFAGKPLNEPVVFGGPFVMNTHAEIAQAYADYREGRF
jgi:redox-sensitive bicupin YhaK (pirin superfamily)